MHNNYKNRLSLNTCLVVLLLLIANQSLFSQDTRLDSIDISTVEKNIRLENPYLSFFHPLDFSATSFNYSVNKQGFKRVQSPEKSEGFNFNSQGVFQLSPKVALSGRLNAVREKEHAVPFILTEERTTNQSFIHNPSYFYAPRAADWLKQDYNIYGVLAYRPVNFLITQLGVEGNFTKAYRDADPRPKTDHYGYNIFSKIGLNWKQHSLFAKGKYFNDYRANDIMYVNLNTNVPSSDSVYIRYNEGYGNQYKGTLYSSTEYKSDGYIWGGEYAFNNRNIHFSAGYDYQYFIERFYKVYTYKDTDNQNYRVYDKYSGLRTDKHSVYANFLGQFNGYNWASRFDFWDQLDDNFNYELKYRTYRLHQYQLGWNNSVSWFNSKNESQKIRLDLLYGRNNVKDISVVLNREINYFQYRAGYEKEFRINADDKLAVGVDQYLYLPVHKNFVYTPYESNKENIFVQKIAIPDYAYDASEKLGLTLNLKYKMNRGKIRYEMEGVLTQNWLAANEYKQAVPGYNGNANFIASFALKVFY
ncbi:hypothetical protein J2810_002823 [Chryseobacterium rhizosphaerae]|uniref:DUF6850 family outer membrane beta-barrel protein n=1 Tax=Chryseobacterium rhizosphaerae TaxID=395937 RepID=UPI00285B047D|nr:DUF6850 family outer membrane beta-barrel protein [Chryseobacterium rhizosphaerae]MDR6546763.1 hypothetical protein [Chryseobacterium rhizosphaerae]